MAEGAPAHGIVAHLLPPTYKRLVAEWLEEDTPSLDYGGFVVGEDMSEAKLLGKSKVCYDHALMSVPGKFGKRAWS
jgi:nicotinate-nucleotide pyrophosphorylase (carboxylating)